MGSKFEYKFIRLKGKHREEYQDIVRQEAEKGWRLVQILAPGAGGLWASADYFEIVVEREAER